MSLKHNTIISEDIRAAPLQVYSEQLDASKDAAGFARKQRICCLPLNWCSALDPSSMPNFQAKDATKWVECPALDPEPRRCSKPAELADLCAFG